MKIRLKSLIPLLALEGELKGRIGSKIKLVRTGAGYSTIEKEKLTNQEKKSES